MELRITTNVDTDDFIESLFSEEGEEGIMKFILDIDGHFCNADFTEELIYNLICSMEKDDENFLVDFLERKFPNLIEVQKKIKIRKE